MRGVIFVIALLACVWSLAFVWILTRVWGLKTYCIEFTCYQLTNWLDKLNFITMNATAFTWAITPIIITLAVFPLLYFVIRALKNSKRHNI